MDELIKLSQLTGINPMFACLLWALWRLERRIFALEGFRQKKTAEGD